MYSPAVTGEQEHIYSSRGLQSFIKHTVREHYKALRQEAVYGLNGEHQTHSIVNTKHTAVQQHTHVFLQSQFLQESNNELKREESLLFSSFPSISCSAISLSNLGDIVNKQTRACFLITRSSYKKALEKIRKNQKKLTRFAVGKKRKKS